MTAVVNAIVAILLMLGGNDGQAPDHGRDVEVQPGEGLVGDVQRLHQGVGDERRMGAHAGAIGTVIEGGYISQARGHGDRYLAVRAPRGTLVRVCAVTCIVTTSTDYGPSSRIRPARIADLALGLWLRVCGLPASAGLCRGSVEFLPGLPPTDAAP